MKKMFCDYSFILLCFCSTTLCSFLEPIRTISSSYQYSEDVEAWFKVHRIPATWDDAHANCLQEGAQLASPINSKFLKEMKRLIEKNDIYCGVFTGINNKLTSGYFISIEGIPLNQLSIRFDEKQKCPEVFGDSIILQPYGRLDSVNSKDAYPYICYKTLCNETETDFAHFDNGYKKNDRTGSSYKFYSEGKTWHEAVLTCLKEDAHLAIINSAIEAEVIKAILEKQPRESLKTDYKDTVLVGIFDWKKPRGWLTVNGQTLDKAGFSKWISGQPYQSDEYFCGALYRSGVLEHVWCDKNIAFICERTPFEIEEEASSGEGIINERNLCNCQ